MRPIAAASMLIVAACLAAVYAGSGARGAATPDVPVKIQGAIALELQALRDDAKGNRAALVNHLNASRGLLASTLPQLTDSNYSAARRDVKDAEDADAQAIRELDPKTRISTIPDSQRLYIKNGISRKYGALEAFGFERPFITGVPEPVDAPPVVTSFKADLVPPTTTYTVVASDPDDADLSYEWKNTNTCGRWTPNGTTAVWYHGEDTNCPHDGTYHPGTITVKVSDKHSNCTVTDPNGSNSVTPYDPGEDCSKSPPPSFRKDADEATVQGLLDKVNEAIDLEDSAYETGSKKKAEKKALESAEVLKGLQADLKNLLSTYPKDSDIESIFNPLHEAEELDRQAAALAGAKASKKKIHKTLDQANPKKAAAKDVLEGILKERP